jgi:FkbM family methyltransferase
VHTSELYNILEGQYFGKDMHEKDEIDQLPQLLNGVSVFVDVGASLGQYCFFANRILKHARIYCIEADPIRVRRLRELASAWEKTSTNGITVIHAAAADQIGKVDFFTTDTNVSGGLFKHSSVDLTVQKSLQWSKTEVDCITLDSLCQDIDPDLIKLDVEGSEYTVLLGAREILKKGRCRFLVEVHPWGDKAAKKMPADVFRLFAQFGYDFQRTHRHWLFKKSNALKRFVKGKMIIIVMENAWLKSAARKCVLSVRALRKANPRFDVNRSTNSL